MRRFAKYIYLSLSLLLLALLTPALAQNSDEKSAFIKYVEESISTDNFKIGLNGLQGTLSSNVSLESITIADRKGVWLTIEQPSLIWSRASLLVGKVDVESLTAKHIRVDRAPEPDTSAPTAEAAPFSLPQLPVAVIIEKLAIDRVSIDQSLFGLQSEISLDGKMQLDGGSLDTNLSIERLDANGGQMTVEAVYADDSKNLKLDMRLSEPEDGLFVNLLNIEGAPPVALAVAGDGPISDIVLQLAFDVRAQRVLTGRMELTPGTQGTNLNARLTGPLASILPRQHRPFFGESSDLQLAAVLQNSGAVDIPAVRLRGGNLNAEGRAALLPDGFLTALQLDLNILPTSGTTVLLPVAGGDTRIKGARVNIGYDAQRQGGWTASLVASGIEHEGNRIADATLVASGTMSDVNNALQRRIDFATRGHLQGLEFTDPGVDEAFGDSVRLTGNGEWKAGAPVELQALQIGSKAFGLAAAGKLSGLAYDGNINLSLNQLRGFSALAGRDLSGQARLNLTGMIDLLQGQFDLSMQGRARNIELGTDTVDKLMAGDVLLAGKIARTETGLAFERFRIGGAQFNTLVDGRFSSKDANLQAQAQIYDLAAIDRRAKGPVAVGLQLRGQQSPFDLTSSIAMQSGNLLGRRAENLNATFTGTLGGSRIDSRLSGSGRLNTKPVNLSGTIAIDQPPNSSPSLFLQDLIAEIGATRLQGNLNQSPQGLLIGRINLNSRDISDVAALALVEASGRIDGVVDLSANQGVQVVKTELLGSKVRFDDYRLGSLNLVGTVVDLFGQPKIGATIKAKSVSAAGLDLVSLDGQMGTRGDTSTFDLRAALAQFNAQLETAGKLRHSASASRISLNRLNLKSDLAPITLRRPVEFEVRNGQVNISEAALTVAAGEVTVSGTAGSTLNLQVAMRALPLKIINAIRPDIGAQGTASGEMQIAGTSARPTMQFAMTGSGVGARQLASNGIKPLNFSAKGGFSNNILQLAALQARNSQNLTLNASGRLPIVGSGMDFKADGALPLSMAQPALASRGSSLTGTARFNLAVKGSLSKPSATGLVSVENATLTDPLSNLKLTNIGVLAGLDGDRISINRGQANLAGGGSVSLGGSVGFGEGYPAKLTVKLDGARYGDGQTFSTKVNGALSLSGALLRDPILGGTITLSKTEIAVPESFAGGAELLDVKHVKPEAGVAQTLARIEQATPRGRPTSRPSIMRLDLTVNAPNQIFVRGRGLDAELGGQIRLTGPVTNVSPVGQFNLRRGRLSMLGQRIDLTEGRISLQGDLDPILKLVAQTDAGDVEAFISVEGQVSDIQIKFYSNPELPEDEVLARIIFGRSIDELTPSQIVKLASIAAELTGGNSPGLVDTLRRGTGLDDLDVVQDADGETAVKAGKYLSDNIYLGIQAGQNTEATVNLDITNDITARGSVTSDGQSSVGVFLEKDY